MVISLTGHEPTAQGLGCTAVNNRKCSVNLTLRLGVIKCLMTTLIISLWKRGHFFKKDFPPPTSMTIGQIHEPKRFIHFLFIYFSQFSHFILSLAPGLHNGRFTFPSVRWFFWPHWSLSTLHWSPHHRSNDLPHWTVTV